MLIPVGVPTFMTVMLLTHKVPQLASQKLERGVLSSFLRVWRKQQDLMASFVNSFGRKLSRRDLKWRIKEAFKRARMNEDKPVNQDGLSQLLAIMGLEVDQEDLLRIMNIHGQQGRIYKLGIRKCIQEIYHRFQKKQIILTGNEDPDELTLEQLKALAAEPWPRKANYRSSTNMYADINDIMTGELMTASQFGYGDGSQFDGEQREQFVGFSAPELRALLVKTARDFKATGDMVVDEGRWDGASELERKAVDRLGFLFLTYRPGAWWFELVEMFRKLTMAALLVFIFDGTPSQVGIGFMITFGTIVAAMIIKPFADPILGSLYVYALTIQMITLFYGMMLITAKFEQLVGEKSGGVVGNGFNVRNLIMGLNCSVFALPFFKFFILHFNISLWVKRFFAETWRRVRGKETAKPTDAEKQLALKAKLGQHAIKMQKPPKPVGGESARKPLKPSKSVAEDMPVAASNRRSVLQNDMEIGGGPTGAEYLGLKRMTQHAELIETIMKQIMEAESAGSLTSESIRDFGTVLEQMRLDAVTIKDEMPTGEAQDRADVVATRAIAQLEHLLSEVEYARLLQSST
eukprot:CAMPEP_0184308506 /NCGR_PEP_ID=MMETSP1049-20130417/16939_1 /TAXON_ID=77928 /ORGANISM="Proteomonas sulcata, Strain CCMP704" /LENGTH=575 /DNA_ID=CAMNT_0026621209 /DNA_START=312 /DNA_END=2039 /DNA_ORIENTATION=-